jgi:CheY-like chemotaxis protein/HPt (histidine-containing phosphotransfer) domain-containing protein
MEERLTKMKISVGNLETLTAKLSRIRMSDLEIESSAKQNKTAVEPTPTSKAKASGLRLLVVDDVAVNQKLLKIQLIKMGFTVDVANDGQQAFDAVKEQNYACVLMDCDMPKVDGYEATAMIRSLPGDKGKVPIIAVTAYDREGDKQKCLDCGMNDYVTKGSHEEDLRQSLEKWLHVESKDDGNHLTLAHSVLSESRQGDETHLDLEDLDKLYGSESEDILKLFMGVTSTYVECLDLALTSKDVDAVNHFAFSIKGPCASLKLGKLAKLAAELPLLAAKHKWREARRVYSELKSLYEPLYLELKEKMGGA